MSIELQEKSTRAAAADYIRQQLAQGKSLAKLLLEALDFDGGKSTALSAVPLAAGEIVQFGWGHARRTDSAPRSVMINGTVHAAYPTLSANEQLADAVYALLGSRADLCLLENSIAQADDPWLRRAKSRLLFHGREVYHALFSVDRDKARIIDAIHEAERPPVFVGAVGRVPCFSGPDVTSLHAVTAEQLAEFAKTARCVFVRAYDGEGYLIWKRVDSLLNVKGKIE